MVEQLRQGRSEAVWSSLKRGVVLGSERFAEKMRKQADVVREMLGRRVFRKAVKWEDVSMPRRRPRARVRHGWRRVGGSLRFPASGSPLCRAICRL
jgi:hypothetical protein